MQSESISIKSVIANYHKNLLSPVWDQSGSNYFSINFQSHFSNRLDVHWMELWKLARKIFTTLKEKAEKKSEAL